ncbi:zinc finger protein 573-like isoform X1 [Teleopsis dalmanni]|uniref:zinc finger protein 573-like isoform X1 n=1 Tax=Teleopsis dalmanni TaxID=139649 RepID=UPI0018CE6BCC|nr:zinc finger protein 573-like isoform X1 [Teleopsis dalmanni]XP_037960695.1 zinc finger protein 573-like isoform X1 [Teleopsis dalmanni]
MNIVKEEIDISSIGYDEDVFFETEDDNSIGSSYDILEGSVEEADFLYIPDDNLETYLSASIRSNLMELDYDWRTECNYCAESFKTFQELLNHIYNNHNTINNELHCVLRDCTEAFANEKLLTRHIIFLHGDLNKLKIYGCCSDCGLPFSNFLVLNKHSCYQKLKLKSGLRLHCSDCQMDFQSFKRYKFHLQFHLIKHRPKCCLICGLNIADDNELFEHVQYFHEQSDQLTCTCCDRIFKDKERFEAHCNTQKSNLKYYCDFCPKKYANKSILATHMKISHLAGNPVSCTYCNKQFPNSICRSYKNHIKNHELIESQVQSFICTTCGLITRDEANLNNHLTCNKPTLEEEIITYAYTCEFCSSNFKSAYHLQTHRATRIHDDNLYHCLTCEENFTCYKSLRTHEKYHSVDQWKLALSRVFMCAVKGCGETYVQWSGYHSHKTHCHLEETCVTCKETFKNTEQLAEHMETCSNTRAFTCQFCKKVCPTKMSLAVHVARSHNNKNLKCSICKSIIKNKALLEKHMDSCHQEMRCNECHKIFKNGRNLEKHKKIVHESIKRYFCKSCDKGFYYKSELKQHNTFIHKPFLYECNECLFTTNYKNSFDIHMAMHREQLQHKCPICNRMFGRKYALNLHIKRHSDHKEFICSQRIKDGCDASFISNYLLRKHIKSRHSNYELLQLPKLQNNQSISELELQNSIDDADDPLNVVNESLNYAADVDNPPHDFDDLLKNVDDAPNCTDNIPIMVVDYDEANDIGESNTYISYMILDENIQENPIEEVFAENNRTDISLINIVEEDTREIDIDIIEEITD